MVSQSPQLADLPVGNIANSAPISRQSARMPGAEKNSASFEGMLSSAHEASVTKNNPEAQTRLVEKADDAAPRLANTDEPDSIPATALDAQKPASAIDGSQQVMVPFLLQEVVTPMQQSNLETSQKALLKALEAGQTQGESDANLPQPSSAISEKGLLPGAQTATEPDASQANAKPSDPELITTTTIKPEGLQPSASAQNNNIVPNAPQQPDMKQSVDNDQHEQIINQSAKADEASSLDKDQNITTGQPGGTQQSVTSVTMTDPLSVKADADQSLEATQAPVEASKQLAGQADVAGIKIKDFAEETTLTRAENTASAETRQSPELATIPSDKITDISEQEVVKPAAVTTQSTQAINRTEGQSGGNEPAPQANAKQAPSQIAEIAVLAKQADKMSEAAGKNELKSNSGFSPESASENAESQENPLTKPQDHLAKARPANGDSDNNLAAIRAPKGEAFSRMMAKIEPFAQTLDQMSQTDTSLRTDPFGQLPTETSTVRLTGMEQLARTGQLPTQASLANSQAIATQISKFAKNGDTRFEIKLDPAELGKIDVRLTIGSDGQTRAHLFVERSETLDFLMRDARGLERALQQSGVDLDRKGLEFSLMDQGSQNNMAGQQQSQENNHDGDKSNRIASNDNSVSDELHIKQQQDRTSETYLATDGLNMII